MSARAGAKLEQFGYDQLGRGRTVSMAQTGAIADDYILGPGDQIIVSLRGQENSELRAEVNRNGEVILPRLAPLAASGRAFGSFRQDLEAAVHRAYVATDASVSISRVRQISVLVSGEVNVPGERLLTGLSSAVDAILVSGGVKKSGSLRSVRIQRGGKDYTVDLYSVLTGSGNAPNLRLADGDRIIVPPLGRTVAVAGLVRQPGIFELASGQSAIPVRTLLSLSGGQEVRGAYRLSVLRIDAQGNSNLDKLIGQTGQIRDSEILFVQLGSDQTASQATLAGGTGLAGAYPVVQATRLSDMLRAPGALGNSPYTLFGIIVRKDPGTLLRSLVAFTPAAVLSGKENIALQTDDFVRPLSVNEASLLSNVVRAYLEKLASDQAILRNPLTDQGVETGATRLPLPSAGGLPQTVPTLPVSKIDEVSFAIDQLTSAPADVQRADIVALMDLRAPGTLGAGSQEAMLERQDQTGLQQRNATQSFVGNGTAPITPNGMVPNASVNPQMGAVGPGTAGYPYAGGPNGGYAPNASMVLTHRMLPMDRANMTATMRMGSRRRIPISTGSRRSWRKISRRVRFLLDTMYRTARSRRSGSWCGNWMLTRWS